MTSCYYRHFCLFCPSHRVEGKASALSKSKRGIQGAACVDIKSKREAHGPSLFCQLLSSAQESEHIVLRPVSSCMRWHAASQSFKPSLLSSGCHEGDRISNNFSWMAFGVDEIVVVQLRRSSLSKSVVASFLGHRRCVNPIGDLLALLFSRSTSFIVVRL
jgi:hypothetical protein